MESPKVLLGRVYEKTSGRGNTYFTGRLGAARVVMLRDDRTESPDPVWQIFVQDGDTGPRQAQEARQPPAERRPAPPPPEPTTRPRRRAAARSGGRGSAVRDWQAPLDRDDDLNMPLPPDMQP